MTATTATADPIPSPAAQPAPPPPRWALPALLAICLLVNVICLPARTSLGDPMLYREEARSLILAGRLWVGPEIIARAGDPGQYFVLNPRDNHWYSKYGILNSLTSLPPLLAERLCTGQLPGLDSPARLHFLNAWHALLATTVAFLLFRVASLYTHSPWVALAWTLLCCYATSMWFYLRAQAGEVFQILFFLAFFDQFVRHLRHAPGARAASRHLLIAMIWAGALCLSKVVYVLVLPIAAAWSGWRLVRSGGAGWRTAALVVGLPVLVTACLLGGVNFVRFGSPLLTGYHQWHADQHRPGPTPWVGVLGFLFASQQSIFTHFPVLLLALPGVVPFFRRHRGEATFGYVVVAVFLLAIGSLPSWAGGWSYGPRYLLFALPVAALPAVYTLGWLFASPVGFPRVVAGAACALILGSSVYLQLQVNALDFFTYYQVRGAVEAHSEAPVPRYFYDRQWGRIYADLRHFAAEPTRPPQFLNDLRGRLDPASLADVARQTRQWSARGNYYWWEPVEPPKLIAPGAAAADH